MAPTPIKCFKHFFTALNRVNFSNRGQRKGECSSARKQINNLLRAFRGVHDSRYQSGLSLTGGLQERACRRRNPSGTKCLIRRFAGDNHIIVPRQPREIVLLGNASKFDP